MKATSSPSRACSTSLVRMCGSPGAPESGASPTTDGRTREKVQPSPLPPGTGPRDCRSGTTEAFPRARPGGQRHRAHAPTHPPSRRDRRAHAPRRRDAHARRRRRRITTAKPRPEAQQPASPDAPRRPWLSRLPGHERVEHPDRRTGGRLELGDTDLDDRARPRPAHGLRVVCRVRDPVPDRDERHPAFDRGLRLQLRVRPRRLPDPGQPAHRGRLGSSHPAGRSRRVPAVRALQRTKGRRVVGCRQRRDLGHALERAPAGRLDECRCRRAADPAGPRPLRRGGGRRDRPRAAVHHEPDADSYIYPARHQAGESGSLALPPMGLRVRLKAGYDTSRFSPRHARSPRRSSATA